MLLTGPGGNETTRLLLGQGLLSDQVRGIAMYICIYCILYTTVYSSPWPVLIDAITLYLGLC